MALVFLADWDNFYVIIGSSAAGLTGLTFVVIALAADSDRTNTHGLRAFVTPTVVHFATVLALAAFLSVPHQNLMGLSVGFAAVGVAGVVYAITIAAALHRYSSTYVPVFEDWLWHVVLPALVYATLLAIAFLIWHRPEQSLYGVAASSTLLLFIGIHNAWDVAVAISMRKQKESA
ncbi:MAG TPA: hypothetical protein VII70_10565 [Steroidobacteraceae bacterium]